MSLSWDFSAHRFASLGGADQRQPEQRRNRNGFARAFRGLADQLSVNELHRGRYRSLVQLTGLLRSYEVGARRRGCCTYLLYCCPALLNLGIKAM